MSDTAARPPGNRLFQKKSIEHIQREAARSELKRTLGPWNLVSLGVGASTPMSDDTAQDLLRLVDANLYRAKSLGRNRLVAEPFAERERARA